MTERGTNGLFKMIAPCKPMNLDHAQVRMRIMTPNVVNTTKSDNE